VSQFSESVYQEAPTERPEDENEDDGWNTELPDHVLKEDREKDALWEKVDGAAIKEEWESANRKWWSFCSRPEVSRAWKRDESQELYLSR
jgi:hypothetical protein